MKKYQIKDTKNIVLYEEENKSFKNVFLNYILLKNKDKNPWDFWKITDLSIEDQDLSGINLSFILKGCLFKNCNFSDSKLEGEFIACELYNCNLSKLQLVKKGYEKDEYDDDYWNNAFRNCIIYNSDFSENNFNQLNINSSDIKDCNFTNTSFNLASLQFSSFTKCNFTGSDLTSAYFYKSKFSECLLESANLDKVKEDLFNILKQAEDEIDNLLIELQLGNINGNVYQGECACLIGTIANKKNKHYLELHKIRPDNLRPAERWFSGINPRDTPENSQVSKIANDWILEYKEKMEKK